jgi:hypothetical protein
MAEKSTNQIKFPSFPVLRKIYKVGEDFVCGVCRTHHPTHSGANNCLNACWFELQQQYPLLVRTHPRRGPVYRCQLCSRDYKDENAALECARVCSLSRTKRHIQEQLINGLPIRTERSTPFHLVKLTNHSPTRPMQPNVTKSPKSKTPKPTT